MRAVVFILALAGAAPAIGQHLGVHGALWEIQEEDAVNYIKRRVGELQKDGTVDRIRNNNEAKIKDAILHPIPVPGYAMTTASRTWYFDPTIILDRSITDTRGRLLYPSGTRVNPLMYGGLSKRLIFIDARDNGQVEFALDEVKKHPRDAVILIAGDWVGVSKRLGSQAYYDQAGAMTKRFQLSKVPSIISQEGLMLKIEERVP
jgi:conjugal transfer pilus assembly protein TraW